MNAIALDGLTVRLGARTVLDQLTLAIPAGSFVGVLGPNGAGKTTLFRTLLGLIRPTAGTLRLAPGPIGYMPQSRILGPGARLRTRDFIASSLGGARWGLPRTTQADHADIDRVLTLVDALALADRPIGTLSGGERQRVLIAQSLLGDPKLLILDEPLLSLDPRRQAEIIALVASLHRTLGLTILFSAHELNPLLGVLDLVLYLGGGHASIGPVDDVVTAPILSQLYGTPIDVIRANGHLFVMAGTYAAEGACACPPGLSPGWLSE